MSWPLVKYILTAAVRDKLIVSMIAMIILGISLAVFMGSAAAIEKQQFTLVFAAGGLRLVGVLGLVLFVVSHVRRSFEHKDVEFLLSRPIGRTQFLLSFSAAFSLLAIAMGIAVSLPILLLSADHLSQGNVLWMASIVAEFVIMVNAALFFSMWISSIASASMVTLAFYVLARMMGQVLGIVDHNVKFQGFEVSVQVVSFITPRLDLMGQTSWLLYGAGDSVDLPYIFSKCAIFTALLLLAALYDLSRRQF